MCFWASIFQPFCLSNDKNCCFTITQKIAEAREKSETTHIHMHHWLHFSLNQAKIIYFSLSVVATALNVRQIYFRYYWLVFSITDSVCFLLFLLFCFLYISSTGFLQRTSKKPLIGHSYGNILQGHANKTTKFI